jgi:hypothetical protein
MRTEKKLLYYYNDILATQYKITSRNEQNISLTNEFSFALLSADFSALSTTTEYSDQKFEIIDKRQRNQIPHKKETYCPYFPSR